MTAFDAVYILFFGSLVAGFLGALSGLGGGMVIVPLLTLGIGIDIHYAIGASLIAVIATSTGASVAFVREGYTNIRLGLFLETATSIGAVFGVVLGGHLTPTVLFFIFGIVLLYSALSMFFHYPPDGADLPADHLAGALHLDSCYPTKQGMRDYRVQHVPWGYAIMFIAGGLSGLLGIGSGAFKVIAMDKVMKLPFKVSTTTSNFMIGVTAAAGAGIYLGLGYIDPVLTMPIVLGVTLGAFFGARLLPRTRTVVLRYVFGGLVVFISLQMIYRGIHGVF